VYLTNLLAVGSTSKPNASLMIQRINVIASTTVSPVFPTFRVFRRASSTERSTDFNSDWCEICVARRSILRSKSGAFNMSWTAVMALGITLVGPEGDHRLPDLRLLNLERGNGILLVSYLHVWPLVDNGP
jgi:hypothetical protein